MPALNWGMIQDGGAFESLMHAILYAEDPGTILFGRPGRDAGQDARTADGAVVYQAKHRQSLVMDGVVALALEELDKIKDYRQPSHANHKHWRSAQRWILVANFSINPNDDAKWQGQVVPAFHAEGLTAEYWQLEALEGKLTQHSEVRDVFFGGENRVLVGLKEAHDLLSAECVGSPSLDVPMVGRDGELDLIRNFAASGDKRVLPLTGPGGIGKSRLLYEALVLLAQDGWRVLWGLPGTMAKSSHWFRLLNGAQKTCVALDAPDDPSLLREVVEQLATVERRNWRVLITCRTERAEALRRFRTHRSVHTAFELGPLDEPTSHSLVNACLTGQAQPPWLHSVYGLAHGVPGWLCLIAELAKRGALLDLPPRADDVAAIYVGSCLDSLGVPHRAQGLTVLRWLALWGTIRVESGSTEQAEFAFLDTQGVPERTARDLLARLVATGLVRNWGVGKRLYAVEPPIVRQQVLSSWLLCENAGAYEVSGEGAMLVSQLVEGRVPGVDAALDTLSHLARSRLTEPGAVVLLGPMFSAMATIAREGNVLGQYRVADLVEKAGAADPESALEVFALIRQNVKESMDVDIPHWGPQPFTHDSLVASLPWKVFQIAERVSDQVVARRYIDEFRQLVALEDADELDAEPGKGPRQLLKRILCELKNSEAYAQPAHDLVVAELASPKGWPFVGLVAECLLNPVRESMEWVANWTITLTKRAFLPGSLEWNLAADLREKAYVALQNTPEPAFRGPLWRILAESHHSFHRAVLHDDVRGAAVGHYRAILVDDLTACAAILRSPPVALTIEEATQAREMWSWYLKYGGPDDPVDLASQCEQIYNDLSTWRCHFFFRPETEEEVAPEMARIAGLLRSAPDPEVLAEFFHEAKRYLDAARQSRQDMADDWRISNLADACADLFSLDASAPANAVTAFVFSVLAQAEPANPMAWAFVVRVCRRRLLVAKSTEGADVADELSRLLSAATAKSRLLWGLYSNVHPASTGTLTGAELNCILAHEVSFSAREWFVLLGAFSVVDQSGVQARLRGRLHSLRNDPAEASECMACFIRSTHLAALRYESSPTQLPAAWIISMITEFQLDGALLGMHDLEWLRDRANLRLDMVQLGALIRSRIELEQRPKPDGRFEIVPHDLAISAWSSFGAANHAEVNAFHDLCRMALGHSFTAMYWMPKYIAELDPSGQYVGAFVEARLSESPDMGRDALVRLGYLASAYDDHSDAWMAVARPICARTQAMARHEREQVYFGLARKETGVLSTMRGEVTPYYVTTRDRAARLRDAEPSGSPLRGCREWALRRAEADLRREQERAEEDADG